MRALERQLGWLDATNITIGVVIGSAIFLVPGEIARSLTTPAHIVGIWLLTGLLSFFGALAYAELGAMLPETGGQYIYLREAYGPLCGFLYGWSMYTVVESGGIATLAAGFAIYLGEFIVMTPLAAKLTAAGVIAVLTVVNYRGLRAGARTQNVLTGLKVAGLLVLIGAALGAPATNGTAAPGAPLSIHAFGVAMVACLWAYEGWNSVSFVAGEVRRPERNLARSLAAGMAVVIALYVLANIAYLRVMPIAEIARTERVAAVVANRTLGRAGGTLFAITILISIAGSINGSILTVPRGYFAQARDGLFFRNFGKVHPRHGTPGVAIALSSVWSGVLALTGTYETLYSYVVFTAWIFYGLTAFAVVVLRRKLPHLPRPYRMHGYPWTPVIFAAVSFWFVGNTLVSEPRSSMIGLAILAAGVPVYWLWKRTSTMG
jgi:APA family basic amino acid/polyamine antiporter